MLAWGSSQSVESKLLLLKIFAKKSGFYIPSNGTFLWVEVPKPFHTKKPARETGAGLLYPDDIFSPLLMRPAL